MQAASSQSIQSTVADALRERIISGELQSGTGLSEIALASEFGVSRTPVREALKQLQTEGLVQIRPRVGTYVTVPSRLEIIELFQLKEILEGAAAGMLASRGAVPEIEALRLNVQRSDEAVARDDGETYATLVGEYHELIMRGAGNSKLEAAYTLLMNQLAYPRLVHTSLSRPGRLFESDTEHRQVLDMIMAKDASAAERTMRAHVRASQEALLERLPFAGKGA